MAAQDSNISETSLPQGTVTFLFTDVQGSTKLLRRLGDAYGEILTTHRRLLRAAFEEHGGKKVDTQGDAFFIAFTRARDAIAAAVASQRALLDYDWPHGEPVLVRMGIHSGEPIVVDGHYIGIDVHRAARICSAAHGGQVVISATTQALVQDIGDLEVSFRDLGLHRLKDLERPERIVQIVADGLLENFPPVKSLRPPTNIPNYAGELVGRNEEIAELRDKLRGDDVRLVTVTGPGGIGKTRLAAAVALDLGDKFGEGAFFVDLTQVRTADRATSEIADTLGVSREDDWPALRAIVDYIGDKHMVLLLDNFEQVIEAATAVAELVRRCPRLTVLVTSRVVLSIGAEHEYPLEPLGLPRDETPAAVAESEAAQLFEQRGAQARPAFRLTDDNAATVAEICGLLDGLPLAIELAAARLRVFSPDALLQRLGSRLKLLTGGATDAHVRHRALRATIDWSCDLLSESECEFFRDLSVFSGGASLDAIERVIGAGSDVLTPLTTLINHSLLRQLETDDGDVRFTMLQTIREYALELLEESPDQTDVRNRHARFYLDLCEHAATAAATDPRAFVKIDSDYDNVMAALVWLLERGGAGIEAAALALRLAAVLGRYWYTHGYALEGARWLQRALDKATAPHPRVQAEALRWMGVLLEQQRRAGPARDALERALELFRREGDRPGEGACLNSLGIAARSERELEEAERLLSQSVAIRRDLKDDAGISTGLSNLGIIALDRGDLDRAEELFEEAMAGDRDRGNDWAIACSKGSLGVVHLERGDLEAARTTIVDGLRAFIDLGDLDGIVDTIGALAGVAAAEGRHIRTARLGGAVERMRRRLGTPLSSGDQDHWERWLRRARRDLGDRFDKAWAEGAQMTTDQTIRYTLEGVSPASDSGARQN